MALEATLAYLVGALCGAGLVAWVLRADDASARCAPGGGPRPARALRPHGPLLAQLLATAVGLAAALVVLRLASLT